MDALSSIIFSFCLQWRCFTRKNKVLFCLWSLFYFYIIPALSMLFHSWSLNCDLITKTKIRATSTVNLDLHIPGDLGKFLKITPNFSNLLKGSDKSYLKCQCCVHNSSLWWHLGLKAKHTHCKPTGVLIIFGWLVLL